MISKKRIEFESKNSKMKLECDVVVCIFISFPDLDCYIVEQKFKMKKIKIFNPARAYEMIVNTNDFWLLWSLFRFAS
jgi:hypothetical protein